MIAGIDYTGVAVSFLCHDGKGNFLFHKRSRHTRDEQGKWDWGAGKLEFGETIEEALKREIKEEYGCDILSIDEIIEPTIWSKKISDKKSHWVTLMHIVRIDRSKVKNNEPRSIEEIGWFKLDNLPKPLHIGVVKKVVRFKDIIEKYS